MTKTDITNWIYCMCSGKDLGFGAYVICGALSKKKNDYKGKLNSE